MFFSETLNFHTSPGNISSQIVSYTQTKIYCSQKVVHTCQLKSGGYTHTTHELSVTEQNFQPL